MNVVEIRFLHRSFSVEEKLRGLVRDGEYTSPQNEILDSIHYAKRIQMTQILGEKQVFVYLKRLKKRNFLIALLYASVLTFNFTFTTHF